MFARRTEKYDRQTIRRLFVTVVVVTSYSSIVLADRNFTFDIDIIAHEDVT